MSPVRRRLCAILFSDKTGHPDAGELVRLMTAAIYEHRGSPLNSVKDGVVAVFDSASDAIFCAVAVQRSLAKGGQRPVRIGIHIGDVELHGGEAAGEGVAIARRIEPMADPGGICVSQAVYDTVKARPEIQTVNVGSQIYRVLTGMEAVRSPWRPRGWVWVAALLIVAAAAALGWRVETFRRSPPSASFTIAVAPFSGPPDEASVMRDQIKKALDEKLHLEKEVRILTENITATPRNHAAAKALGAGLKADAVIWGDVEIAGKETRIHPHLTLVNGPLPSEKAEPEALHALIDQPDQLILREQKAGEMGNLALLLLAKYYHKRQETEKALSILKRIDPPNANSLIEKALVLHEAGRWPEMQDALREALAQKPDNVFARRLLAWNRFLLGDPQRAIAELEAVRRAAPKDAKTCQLLDSVYLYLGGEKNLRKALEYNRQARRLDPKSPVVDADLGAIYYQQGKYAEAAEQFLAFVNKAPSNFFAHFLCYTALRRAGQNAKAKEYIHGALRVLPSAQAYPDAVWDRALASFLAGKASEQELVKLMGSEDPFVRRRRRCTGYFYLGVTRLLDPRGPDDPQTARDYLSKSLAAEIRNYYEHPLARYELSLLDSRNPS